MPNRYVSGTATLTSETLEIVDADLMQILWRGGAITSATETPQIYLHGINIFVATDVFSSTELYGRAYRKRYRGGIAGSASEIPDISLVGVLPEKYISAGSLTYNGNKINGQTIPKGSYLPLTFEVSGDRLTVDMDVVLTVEKNNGDLIFQKKVKLGVFDDNTVILADGRDSISGTIIVLPGDTANIPGTFTEVKYSLRLANRNIRNYFLESGSFILKDV